MHSIFVKSFFSQYNFYEALLTLKIKSIVSLRNNNFLARFCWVTLYIMVFLRKTFYTSFTFHLIDTMTLPRQKCLTVEKIAMNPSTIQLYNRGYFMPVYIYKQNGKRISTAWQFEIINKYNIIVKITSLANNFVPNLIVFIGALKITSICFKFMSLPTK